MQLALSKNAQREYERIPERERAKIKKKLISLKNSPHSSKKLSGEFAGYYSIKAWPYRILYEINKKKNVVEVHKISHRQRAYK